MLQLYVALGFSVIHKPYFLFKQDWIKSKIFHNKSRYIHHRQVCGGQMGKLIVAGWHLDKNISCDRCKINYASILVLIDGLDELDLCKSCEKDMISEGSEVNDKIAEILVGVFAAK